MEDHLKVCPLMEVVVLVVCRWLVRFLVLGAVDYVQYRFFHRLGGTIAVIPSFPLNWGNIFIPVAYPESSCWVTVFT
jgi:hypothetical protein